jgi:V/A-type H+/Na+-transporting ATPase subunit E
MALADIVKRIAEDARREADDLVLAAERSADALREEAETRARYTHEQILTHGRAEVEAEAKTRLASARLAARDRLLAAKRDLVQRTFEGAVVRLESLPDEEYSALIAREIQAIARGGEQIVLGESDERRLSTYLPGALAGREVGTAIGGSTAAIDKGALLLGERMRVEVSVRALVDGRADQLTALIGGILFGDAETAGSGGAEG